MQKNPRVRTPMDSQQVKESEPPLLVYILFIQKKNHPQKFCFSDI